MSDVLSIYLVKQKRVQELLVRTPVIAGACELDLLLFLYRHPRTLLTNEQLATFVGYDVKQIAKSIDSFLEARLLERTQNPTHAARMYRLVLEGPSGGDLLEVLEFASTRQGRRDLLTFLDPKRFDSSYKSHQSKRKSRVI